MSGLIVTPPLGLGFDLANNSRQGETHFRIPAIVDIHLRYQDNPREKTLMIKCKGLDLSLIHISEPTRPY